MNTCIHESYWAILASCTINIDSFNIVCQQFLALLINFLSNSSFMLRINTALSHEIKNFIQEYH